MSQLSRYFNREEFACHCGCGFDVVDAELLQILINLRAHFEQPVTIVSGARCVHHNTEVGGAKESQHLLGKAADIKVEGLFPLEVYVYLDKKYPGKYGIKCYDTFVHIDCRGQIWRELH